MTAHRIAEIALDIVTTAVWGAVGALIIGVTCQGMWWVAEKFDEFTRHGKGR